MSMNDESVPPSTSEANQPLTISCYLTLQKLLDVDSKEQTFTIAATATFEWLDKKHLSDRRGPAQEGIVSAEKIWTPDVGITNSVNRVADVDWRKIFPVRVYYKSENDTLPTVAWTIREIFTLNCHIDVS